MLRVLGAALVAAGCAWGGFRAAAGLRAGVRALEEMEQGLALLEQELEWDSPPLPQLMDRLIPRSSGPAKELFQGSRSALERLEEESFSRSWKALVGEREALGREGRDCLLPLGDVLGRCTGEEQRRGIQAARLRLRSLSARAEEDSRRLGRVYRTLGLSGGAFLVIVLL